MGTMDDMFDMYKLLEYLDRPVTRRLQHKDFDFGRERMPDGAPGLVLQMTATASAADKEKTDTKDTKGKKAKEAKNATDESE